MTRLLKLKKQLLLFISVLLITGYCTAQEKYMPAVESFESKKVLSYYDDEQNNLSVSEKHRRYGNVSLKWEWNEAGSFGTSNFRHLTMEESPLQYGDYFPASPTLNISIYNETPQKDSIRIAFYKNGEEQVYFDVEISFKGWRRVWVPFYEMYGNAPEKGKAVDYDYFRISTNSNKGKLFFDDIVFSQYQDDRHQYPDNLVPFIKKDLKLREDFWMPLDVNFKRIENLETKPLSLAAKMDLNNFEKIIEQDLEVPKKYKTYINSLKADFDALGIYEKDGFVYGPPLTVYEVQEYFEEAQQGSRKFNDVKALSTIMRKLSHFHDRSTPEDKKEIERMFILGTKYFLDQGWQAGSSGGTRHHVGYYVKGMAESFFTMRKILYREGLLKDAGDSLYWLFNLGMFLNDPSTFKANLDYLNTQSYYHLMLIFLSEKQEKQAALLKAYSKYMSIVLAQQDGIRGFKIDGTSWHHNGHYPAYGIGAFQNVPKVIKTLSRTRFRINTKGHENFKNAFLATSKYSQKFNWGFGNAGRHPLENNGIESLKKQYLMMAQSGSPDGREKIDKEVAGAYLRLWGKEDVFNATIFRDIEGIKEQQLDPYMTLPYAATAIHRKSNIWAAIIKGYSKYVWASENYVDENRYGRYPANGSIQLLNSQGELGSGFRQEGWDWNRYPGTTIIYLPFKELEPKKPLLMFRSDETFAGATELNGNGVFGMILNEGSGSNADGEETKNGYPGKLKAKKSVFSFGDKLICIGTNISSVDKQNLTQTNLFQSYMPELKKSFNSSIGKIKKKELTYKLNDDSDKKWVIDPYGNGYHILSESNVFVQKKHQESYHNKYSINTGKMNAKGKGVTDTEGDYATGWIDHGFAPGNDSYQYVIYPFMNEEDQDGFQDKLKNDDSYKILRADKTAHIVQDNLSETIGYVVFESDSELNNGILKKVSEPSLVMIDKQDNNYELSLVQPDLNFEAYREGRYYHISREVEVDITLKGKWNIDEQEFVKSVKYIEGNTIIHFECQHGLPRKIVLRE